MLSSTYSRTFVLSSRSSKTKGAFIMSARPSTASQKSRSSQAVRPGSFKAEVTCIRFGSFYFETNRCAWGGIHDWCAQERCAPYSCSIPLFVSVRKLKRTQSASAQCRTHRCAAKTSLEQRFFCSKEVQASHYSFRFVLFRNE